MIFFHIVFQVMEIQNFDSIWFVEDNNEAVNFYKAVGCIEDKVTSFGKRLIEDKFNNYIQLC